MCRPGRPGRLGHRDDRGRAGAGDLFGWLRPHLPWRATALITAALFAAIHGYYPAVLPVAFVLGVALAWLRERTGSILPGILVHILTDSLLFIVALTLR